MSLVLGVLPQLGVPNMARSGKTVLSPLVMHSGNHSSCSRGRSGAHTALPADAPRRPTLTAQLDPEAKATGGRRGLLLCRVDSDPPARLQLLHGHRVMASSLPSCEGCSPRLKVTRSPNLLRVEIMDPVLEDEGVYHCEAANNLGNSSASATFDGQGEWAGARPDRGTLGSGEVGEGRRPLRPHPTCNKTPFGGGERTPQQ